jgi:tetratricopeptide (TPR) repeat protein
MVATILVGGALAYSIWKTSPTTAQQYLNSAKKYYEQKKDAEAIIELLNAIQKDPKSRDARQLLALAYAKENNLNAAAQQLVALLEYFPDDQQASLDLGNIYLTGGRSNPEFFRKAAEIAQKILASDSQNVAALVLSGNAAAGLQDYRSSVQEFEKAISLDPQNIAAFVSLGTTQMAQRNYPDAERAYLQARQIKPKDKDALMSLANYYRAVGDFTKVEMLLREALSTFPGKKDIYIHAVRYYYQVGRFDDIENVLRDAQVKSAKDPSPLLLLVDVYLAKDRTADAQKLVSELKESFPGNTDVAVKAAVSFMQDQPNRARTEIEAILRGDPKNTVGQILLGEVQYITGQYDAAEATLATVPVINSSYPQVRYFLGNIALRKGRLDEAQEHFRRSIMLDSQYLSAGVALAQVLFNKGVLADSRQELAKVLNVKPTHVAARILKAALDTAEKKYAEAEQGLTGLAKEQPDNAFVQMQMGKYYDSRGRSADAEKSLTLALKLQPDSQEILQNVVDFYIREKKTDRAVDLINAIPDNTKQAFHYELMGLAYSQAGMTAEAEKAYRKALEKEPARATTQAYLTADYLRRGQLSEGLKELDQLIKKDPGNASALALKGKIYQDQGNLEEAKESYTQALHVDPNFDAAANNLAYMLAEQGRDLNIALTWAEAARKARPESPTNADTLGWVYYKLGNYVLARNQLEFAVGKQTDSPVYQYHLAMVYRQTNQIKEAEGALRKALGSSKDFKEKPLAAAALNEIGRPK